MNNVYLLLGPEQGNKKQFIEEIKGNFAKTGGEEPELHKIYPFDTDISSLLSLLRNGSLFSAHKLVIFYQTDEITKTADINLLNEYIQNPSPDTTLLLVSDKNSVDKRLEKFIPSKNKKIFWELFDTEKTTWIIRFFRERKRNITKQAADELLELVANNTEEMRTACEQLCFYFDENYTINEDDIVRIIWHSKEENIFTLFEKIAFRDLESSLDCLNSMILSHNADPVQVLAGLLWQIQKLINFKKHFQQTDNMQNAFQLSDIRTKRAQKIYTRGHHSYSLEELQNIIVILADTDNQIRIMGKSFHENLLQMFLYRIIKKRAAS